MSHQLQALARRAVACKGWRWMPGMRTVERGTKLQHTHRLGDARRANWPEEYDWPHSLGLCLPDLADPATLGCLLALVREAWSFPHAHCYTVGARRWAVSINGGSEFLGVWSTEAEALVVALEAAP